MKQEFCVYQDLNKFWFSHFSFFQCYEKNYLIACFHYKKQMTIAWCKLSVWEDFLPEGPCLGYPLSVRLVSGPLVEFQMRPQIQRSVVPFVWLVPEKGSQKICLHLSSGNYLGVIYTLETFVSMYPIPMLGHIRYFYSPCITLHLMWCVNRFQGLISRMCFTCSFWKKAIQIIKPFVLYDWGFSSAKSQHISTQDCLVGDL